MAKPQSLGRFVRARMTCIAVVFCAAAAISSTAATTFNSLVSFDGTNGARPDHIALVQATDGNLYGTTQYDGANSQGTVFKITPGGTLNTLYNFCSEAGCADGSQPLGTLIQASNGDLYGTADEGGAYGYGTFFKITTTGTLTTLYNFCSKAGCADGSYPEGPLIQDAAGNFYGTANSGGANNDGTVFKITPTGTLTTLHSFN